MVMGMCFMKSPCSLSELVALSFPSLFAIALISWNVNVLVMGQGGVERNPSVMVCGERVYKKYWSIIFIFSDVEPGALRFSSFTRMGILCLGQLISLIT